MKKLIVIVALMLTVVSFASETKKNENKKLLSNSLNYENLKEIIENVKTNNLKPIEKTEINILGGLCSTTVWGHYTLTKVLSMDSDYDTYELTYHIDGGCTTCFFMGHAGVTSSTNCW